MAFNAEILLDLLTTQAERSLKKVEKSLAKVEKRASDIDVKFDVDRNSVRRVERALANVDKNRIVEVDVVIDQGDLNRVQRQLNSLEGRATAAASGLGARPSAALLPAAAAAAGAGAAGRSPAQQESLRNAGLAAELRNATSEAAQLRKAVQGVETSYEEIVALSQQQSVLVQARADAEERLAKVQQKGVDQQNKILAKRQAIEDRASGATSGRSVKQLEGDLKTLEATYKRMIPTIRQVGNEYTVYDFRLEEVTNALQKAEKEQRDLNKAAKGYVAPRVGAPGGALPPGGGGGGGGGGRRGGRGVGGLTPGGAGAIGAAVGGLKTQLLGAIGAVVGLNAALQETGRILDATLARSSAEQRLRALTNGWDSYADALGVANRAAERFNISQTEAERQIAQVYGRLRPLGLSLQEIESVYSGFNTAARLSGATAAESAGAFLQLSQALGAGALRGEEFNSVAEQAPAVLSAIARRMDEPVGALKGLAKEGKITRDVVLAALQDIERNGAARLADVLDTPAAKLDKLNARLEDLRVAIGQLYLPAFVSVVEQLTGVIEKSTKRVERYQLAFAQLKSDMDSIASFIPELGHHGG